MAPKPSTEQRGTSTVTRTSQGENRSPPTRRLVCQIVPPKSYRVHIPREFIEKFLRWTDDKNHPLSTVPTPPKLPTPVSSTTGLTNGDTIPPNFPGPFPPSNATRARPLLTVRYAQTALTGNGLPVAPTINTLLGTQLATLQIQVSLWLRNPVSKVTRDFSRSGPGAPYLIVRTPIHYLGVRLGPEVHLDIREVG